MSATGLHAPSKSSRLLNAGLWLAQTLIFLAFAWAGMKKLATPIPELALMWPWAADLPAPFVRSLGLIDLAGGVGVLLPALTRIKPGLTMPAALGCVALQVCAMIFHISRGEIAVLPVNLVFLALLGFIFLGRRNSPIQPRRGSL
jgi:hypothetical protein